MKATEFIDEYKVTAGPHIPDQQHFDRGDALRAKNALGLYQSPMTEFDVMYKADGYRGDADQHSYYFFAKSGPKAGKCVGIFFLDHRNPTPGGRISKILAPNVEVVTPHMSLAPQYQGKGLAKKCYASFLAGGPWVFITKEHTSSAKALWDSLSTGENVSFYFDPSGEISNQPSERNYRFLGPAERFNLGNQNI